MSFVTLKMVYINAGIARESLNKIEINTNAIASIKKVYYDVEKQKEDNENEYELVPKSFYKISLLNGETIIITEDEKSKIY